MFIDIDYNKRKKGYKIYLAKPNKQIITNLSEGFDPTYGVKLGNVNELTFNIPYYIEKEDVRERNENVELIREKMYIKIEYNNEEEWMIIDSLEDIGEGSDMYLVVNSFSNVYETRHKKLTSVELGVVSAKEYYEHILADTSWVIGSIDATFENMYRTMEIGDSTVLESILEGGSTFGAILEFDSINKRINLVDINKKSEYKGLKINYNNFLTSINRTRDTDSMATRLYVYGSEGLTIDSANPTGMPYLEDFSYFLHPFKRDASREVIEHSHYMSDELAHAILDMEELTEEYAPQIKVKQTETDALIVQLINQETELNSLQFDVNTIKGLLDIAKALGDTSLVAQRTGELTQAEALVVSKTAQVETIKTQIDALDRQIVNMQSSISITSFTKALRDELNPFIIESDFTDERYVDDRELYDDAVKKFAEAKTPNITIDASIDNIINSLEEEYFSDKIILGDLARITDEDMNIDFKSLIIELTFGLDSNDCQVVIANEPAEVGGFDKILSILYDTQSTTSQLESNKHKWDSVTELRTEVDILRDGGIDAVKNRITAGVNESVVIGDRGIVLTNPDFPDELVIMQAGVIALSTDGGENWSTSITPKGVIADTIIGKLVASNNLLITNDKGTFRIDSDGLTIDMDSIKIMSGSDNTPENILDTWNQVILTMEDFANDNVLNVYEKSQIKKQWDSIVATHSSMISVAQDAYGPETPENPYPVEYDRYLESYENFNRFLNVTLQSDGHTVLDPNTMNQTTPVNSATYDLVVREYQKHKDTFQTVIPLDFAKSSIEILEQGISLNYVRNGEVATQLNLSEEGVRIDGRLLEINAKTEFNDDLTMNAGVIKSKDNGIVIDLNEGTINLSRPLTINAVPVATKDDLDAIELQGGKSAYEIAVINGFTGSESQWLASLEGTEGEQGIQGPKGINGENSYIHIAWSDSADGLVGFTQNNSANKLYMGVYTNNIEQSSAVPADYEWIKVKGDRGDNAPIVKITGATQIIKVDKDGVVTPSSAFTVSGAGINTNITSWTYSVDGGDFTSAQPTGVLRDGNTITVSPSSSTFKLLVIRASDGKVNDEFTIARTNDGLTGKDAYTVLLSNESHTFAGTEAYAVLANTTTTVMAYKGTTKIPVTINSVTGLPTGMTASINKNNTVDAGVTFTVNNSLVTVSGKVEIRMTIDGNGVSKDFSYALALKGIKGETGDVGPRGATGEQGPRGDQGTSVTGVTEWYLATSLSSGVTTTTSGWTNAIQTMTTDKRFLWNYEQIGFSDGKTQDTIPVIIGAYGQTGGTGSTGATGRSIVSIEENYLASASASGITRTSTGWTTAIQTTDETKKYLWNYEKITWSSAPLVTYVEPIIIGVHGATGAQGPQGVSITGVDVEYAQNTSATTAPTTGWSTTAPVWKDGQYIWSRTKTNYSTGNPTYSTPACITGQKGATGGTGATGGKGDAGRGISSIVEQYYLSRSKDTQFGGEWVEVPPTWVEGRYMWTRSRIVYTNPSGTEYTTAVVDSAWEALEGVTLKDKTEILSGNPIFTDLADDNSVVHVEVDGKSVSGGSGKNLYRNIRTTEFPPTYQISVSTGIVENVDTPTGWALRLSNIVLNGSSPSIYFNPTNSIHYAEDFVGKPMTVSFFVRGSEPFKLSGVDIGTSWTRFTSYRSSWSSSNFHYNFDRNLDFVDISSIQIEHGSTATPYELPAPTPDYPIAINSLNNVDVVSSVGKENLVLTSDKLKVGGQASGISTSITSEGYYQVVATAGNSNYANNFMSASNVLTNELQDGDKFTISFTMKSPNSTGIPTIYLKPGMGYFEMLGTMSTEFSTIYYTGVWRTANNIVFHMGFSTLVGTFIIKNMKIEKGELTPYSLASEDITYNTQTPSIYKTNILLSEPLRSVGGIKDRLFLDTDGLWKVERNVGEYKADGSEDWTNRDSESAFPNIETRWFQLVLPNAPVSGIGKSTHFAKINSGYLDEIHVRIANIANTLYIGVFPPKSMHTTLTDYKNWLTSQKNNGTPLTIQYILATPTIETLSTEQQTKLNGIQSFKGSNYVYTIEPDKSDILSPTLHATFKSKGWYDKYLVDEEIKLVSERINEKVDQDVFDLTLEELAEAKSLAMDAINSGEYALFIEGYEEYKQLTEADKKIAEETLQRINDTIVAIENNLGTSSEKWNFIDSSITNAEGGVAIANAKTSMSVVVGSDRISFFDNEVEVAFITNKVLQITHGIFVTSVQIGAHLISSLPENPEITVVQWVGF